ncbi:MAG: glycosyltransferase family 39 protein [Candidatus Micrarchaeota archaeon]|nr:glycosyltransferase family 39 protein [Candidatus Micrarchaeota archaeon]
MLQAIGSILSYFEWTSGEYFYFYYDIALLAAMIVGTVFAFRYVAKNASYAGKKRLAMLALIVVAFLVLELAFVQPTQQLFNDEYIHMSIAKTIVYDHYAGICSFSIGPHCVSNTAGLLQQPTGWATMLSAAFLAFGVGFAPGYNLVLLLSSISILLMFYIAFMLLKDGDVALLATALFGFTPLFLTFSRSLIIDTPELTVFLLAIALLLTYLKERRVLPGVAACLALAYTLTMKVDAILVLPVALALLVAVDWKSISGKGKKELKMHALLAAVLAILIIPQLIFIYNSWSLNTFGAAPWVARISLYNFWMNVAENVVFWLGGYGSIITPSGWQSYNLEFPLTYTLFAALGAIFMFRGKHRTEAVLLLFWFFLVFIFYTSYYGGEALYGAGDDIRYFMVSFPAVSMLAAGGIAGLVSAARWKVAKARRKRKMGRKRAAKSRKLFAAAVAVALIIIMVSDLVFEFSTFVAKQPQDIYPFSAERFQEHVILGNYTLIPNGCFVLSYEPPLWNVLNVSNMYADWIFTPFYRSELLNLSHGCLYFEYSLDCIVNTGGYKLDNTTPGCTKILDNFTMSPVVSAPYDTFGWNYTFSIYKILSYKNGTPLYK